MSLTYPLHLIISGPSNPNGSSSSGFPRIVYSLVRVLLVKYSFSAKWNSKVNPCKYHIKHSHVIVTRISMQCDILCVFILIFQNNASAVYKLVGLKIVGMCQLWEAVNKWSTGVPR